MHDDDATITELTAIAIATTTAGWNDLNVFILHYWQFIRQVAPVWLSAEVLHKRHRSA